MKRSDDARPLTPPVHDPAAGSHARAIRRTDDGRAFLPDPFDTEPVPLEEPDDATNDFAEELGEEFVAAVTGNEDIGEQQLRRFGEAELGGPYTVTTAGEELADDVDENNPPDATREPFPSPMRANVARSPRRR